MHLEYSAVMWKMLSIGVQTSPPIHDVKYSICISNAKALIDFDDALELKRHCDASHRSTSATASVSFEGFIELYQ